MRVVIGVSLLLLWGLPAAAESGARVEQGRAIFLQHCTACHGTSGGGGGALAIERNLDPPDLRRVAARRGGRFDSREIAAIIDGRAALASHQDREMPAWGDLHTWARAADPGAAGGWSTQMSALLAWLESIQTAP